MPTETKPGCGDQLHGLLPAFDTDQRTRALAVVASLYRYWYDTGYLHANPAAGLSTGGRARAGFTPTRLIPPPPGGCKTGAVTASAFSLGTIQIGEGVAPR